MKILSLLSSIFILAPVVLPAVGPTTEYSHGDPSGDEQLMLEMINRARLDPAGEGQRYLDTTDSEVVGAINFFNVDIEAVAEEFATYMRRPPMAFHPALMETANTHAEYMISINTQTHARPEGTTFRDSFSNEGYNPFSAIGENIYAFSRSVWHGHAGLNVDWGFTESGIQTPPGHRITIMGLIRYPGDQYPSYNFRDVGIAVVPSEPVGQNDVGPLVIAQAFGAVSTDTFLCGVVYNDSDQDGFYSPGEGISGVTITPDRGDYYAVTSASGGYSIPLSAYSGGMAVTISGAGIGPLEATIVLEGENYKLDVVDGELRNTSPWRDDPVEGDSIRSTSMGRVQDLGWPWVYHVDGQFWMHCLFAETDYRAVDGMYVLIKGEPDHWGWTRDDLGGWYYSLADQDWYLLSE